MVLNYFMIKQFGMVGAAWATLISMSVLAMLSFAFAQRVYYIRYEYKRLLLIILFSAGIFYINSLLSSYGIDFIALAAIKVSLLAVFAALLFLLGFFSSGELAFIRETAANALNRFKSRQ